MSLLTAHAAHRQRSFVVDLLEDLLFTEGIFSLLIELIRACWKVEGRILDLVRDGEEPGFHHAAVTIRVRLLDDWRALFEKAGFADVDFRGDWKGALYDRETSRRLIAVARKETK